MVAKNQEIYGKFDKNMENLERILRDEIACEVLKYCCFKW